uniref:Glycine-rich cell wall structural protein 1.8-like n=1 Tax=Elaeis guineensis var. tenera TaxID=51953 RepID=A0A6I9RJL2_ELAGV|nr:glycine-rich cell wall structural protein 1.8-like [Elaeis guineensis]
MGRTCECAEWRGWEGSRAEEPIEEWGRGDVSVAAMGGSWEGEQRVGWGAGGRRVRAVIEKVAGDRGADARTEELAREQGEGGAGGMGARRRKGGARRGVGEEGGQDTGTGECERARGGLGCGRRGGEEGWWGGIRMRASRSAEELAGSQNAGVEARRDGGGGASGCGCRRAWRSSSGLRCTRQGVGGGRGA